MSRKITDPKLKVFIDLFKTQGVKFVDHETGEEIVLEEDNGD